MAAGEYTSVASQRELVQAELEVERRELRKHPQDEMEELAALYESRGVERELAAVVAGSFPGTRSRLWRSTPARNWASTPTTCPPRWSPQCPPSESFALGALLPLLPYLLGATALWPALLLRADRTLRLWGRGGESDGPLLVVQRAAAAALGGAAAAVTYALGALFGTAVG